MVQTREAIGFVAFLIGAAALTAVNHHPTHGRHTERERVAVEAATVQFTHDQIADAWTQAKVGNPQSLLAIERAFPLPAGRSTKPAQGSSSPSSGTRRRASTS
jgi:hypothetical protein